MEDKNSIMAAVWVGIIDNQKMSLVDQEPVVAIIIRKASIHQIDRFLRYRVCINNKRVWTSCTKYGTHGFHSVEISTINSMVPSDAVWGLGWDATKKQYAFNFKGWPCSIQDSAMYGLEEGLQPLSIEYWTEEWKFELKRNPFWSPFEESIPRSQQPIRLSRKKNKK